MMYKLIGKNVSHSYSAEIYNKLGYDYSISDLNYNEFEQFMESRQFSGINVTMPYKQDVIKYLDQTDDIALEIGAVNTVVNKNGELYGYNTDYYGLKYLFNCNDILIKDKDVLILGTGATSKTAASVMRSLGANRIVKVSRTQGKNSITYDDLDSVKDFSVIINTTPNGMYPNTEGQLLDLLQFNNLSVVVDVVYNPIRTNLILQAQNLNIKAIGGFEMLVAQAIKSAQLFFDENLSDDKIAEIYQTMILKKANIVLIGMPTSGKTTIGRKLAVQLNKDFKDTDFMIVDKEAKVISEIFRDDGEDYFRILEAALISELANTNNTIIATGGGSILDVNNVINLKRNGLLVFINRPLELLYGDKTRPLTQNKYDLNTVYNERVDLYKQVCDIEVVNDKSLDSVVKEILEAIKCVY